MVLFFCFSCLYGIVFVCVCALLLLLLLSLRPFVKKKKKLSTSKIWGRGGSVCTGVRTVSLPLSLESLVFFLLLSPLIKFLAFQRRREFLFFFFFWVSRKFFHARSNRYAHNNKGASIYTYKDICPTSSFFFFFLVPIYMQAVIYKHGWTILTKILIIYAGSSIAKSYTEIS